MKKIYAILATAALLASLPALAESLTEKSEKASIEKDSTGKKPEALDKIDVRKEPKENSEAPTCGGNV